MVFASSLRQTGLELVRQLNRHLKARHPKAGNSLECTIETTSLARFLALFADQMS